MSEGPRTPPAKPARRKQSSAAETILSHQSSSPSASSISPPFHNAVYPRPNSPTSKVSSPNRVRAFSSSVTEGLRPPQIPPKPNLAQNGTLSKLSAFTRDQASRLRQIDLSQKRAEVSESFKERLPEWKNKGAEVLEEARAKGEGWGKKGWDAMDRWKRGRADSESYGRLSPTIQQYESDVHIFGSPLHEAVALTCINNHGDALPAVVARCIEYLNESGLDEVGLYRIPGSSTTVSKLRSIFDSGLDMSFKETQEDPHAVAALLKMYLRELPSSIITDNLVNSFNNAVANFAATLSPSLLQNNAQHLSLPQELISEIAHLAHLLPRENFFLLRALTLHLSRIDAKSAYNKMNLSNLGLIFCPTLGIGSILFRCFVTQSKNVFSDPPPPPSQTTGPSPTSGIAIRRTVSAISTFPGTGSEQQQPQHDDRRKSSPAPAPAASLRPPSSPAIFSQPSHPPKLQTDPDPFPTPTRSTSADSSLMSQKNTSPTSAFMSFEYYDTATQSMASGVLNLAVSERRSLDIGRSRRSMSASGGSGGGTVKVGTLVEM